MRRNRRDRSHVGRAEERRAGSNMDTNLESNDRTQLERGAALPIVSLALVLLLGASAFAVDLGWVYLNGNRIQKAADAAALAGVVHITNSMADAQTDAELAASLNGFPVGGPTVMALAPTNADDLEVELTASVETFFLNVFGFDAIDVSKTSTARYVTAVKLGNPGNCFGVGPDAASATNSPCPSTSNIWAAVSGKDAAKLNGDPYSTKCIEYAPGCNSTNPNPEVHSNGYNYGIEVEPGSSGLAIHLYDAGFYERANFSTETGDGIATGDKSNNGPITKFTLYEPDSTPANPNDNTVVVPGCTQTTNPGNQEATYKNKWVAYCTLNGSVDPGVYVLNVESSGNFGGSNQYAVAATTASGPQPQLYGIDNISIFTNQASTVADLNFAEIEEAHAGKKLVLRFFDAGEDDSSDAYMAVKMPDGSFADCTWVATDEGTVTHAQATSAPCKIDTTKPKSGGGYEAKFNGQWITATIDIPDDYACGSDCWWEMEILLNKPHDRTTWEVELIGNPVRLVENN